MNEIAALISEFGIVIVIVGVLVWLTIHNAKNSEKSLKTLEASSAVQTSTLESLRQSCENTATALNIIQSTLIGNTQTLDRVDKRTETMNTDVREINATLKVRPCVSEEKRS